MRRLDTRRLTAILAREHAYAVLAQRATETDGTTRDFWAGRATIARDAADRAWEGQP